jgi:hypothetical protein
MRDDLESLCNVHFYYVLRCRPTSWEDLCELESTMPSVFNPEPSKSPYRSNYILGDFLAPEEITAYLQPAILA